MIQQAQREGLEENLATQDILHACCNFGFWFLFCFGLTLDIIWQFGRNRQLDNAFLCLNLLLVVVGFCLLASCCVRQ